MEEVDNIIIHSLRQIGCDIDENIVSLSSFDAELVVMVVVKCLNNIKPELNMSSELPSNMAARFKIGTLLASAVQQLNYNERVGFQTFLYPSDVELRRLLTFLIEKFPKEDKIEDTIASKISLLKKSVAISLAKSLSMLWVPHYCCTQEERFIGQMQVPYNSIRLDAPSRWKKDKDYEYYYENYQKSVPEQVSNRENIFPSIISYNAKLMYSQPTNIIDRLDWIFSQQQYKSSIVNHSSITSNTLGGISSRKSEILPSKEPVLHSPIKSPMKEETQLKKEEVLESKIDNICQECEHLKLSIEQEQNEIEKLNSKYKQITLIQQSEQQELAVLEEQRRIMAKSYDLLSDGEVNIKTLERMIEAKRCKLITLATEWEETRKPLIDKYRNQKEKNSSKAKVDEIRLLKEKQWELVQEIKKKQQQYIQLQREIQKVPKDPNRSAYTQRILEIINNIKKQKDEIEKVVDDTRNIKKEINNLTGRLDRSYEVVLSMCSDSAAKTLVRDLRSKFDCLIKSVKDTGAIIREIRDLEEQIDIESAKHVEANLARITADLQQMKQETDTLTARLNMKSKILSS